MIWTYLVAGPDIIKCHLLTWKGVKHRQGVIYPIGK